VLELSKPSLTVAVIHTIFNSPAMFRFGHKVTPDAELVFDLDD
jgi:hypothetical protein